MTADDTMRAALRGFTDALAALHLAEDALLAARHAVQHAAPLRPGQRETYDLGDGLAMEVEGTYDGVYKIRPVALR